MKRPVSMRSLSLFAVTFALSLLTAFGATVPTNLGNGLDVILRARLEAGQNGTGLGVARRQQDTALQRAAQAYMEAAVTSPDGQVKVLIYLNGQEALPDVRAALQDSKKVDITGVNTSWRAGVVEAWIKVEDAPSVARAKGVSSVILCEKPVTNVGTTTQAGVVQHRANNVTQNGTGITVGAISNSYDVGTATSTEAAGDVGTGDLPGTGNPLGNTQPVVIIQEGTASASSSADEGRAMLQVIHDVAPAARLGFATSGGSQLNFADNIRSLAAFPGAPRIVPGFRADIVVDDIIFLTEPMFSDGIVAQGVIDVTSQGTHYFSSAGNRPSSQGYASDFRFVSSSNLGAATAGTNLNFTGVDPALYAGGFHNFRTDGGQDIAQDIRREIGTGTTTANIVFQWDDPFDRPAFPGTLVFSQDNVFPVGGTTQDTIIPLNAGTPYRITIFGTDPSDFDSIVTVLDPNNNIIVNAQDTGTGETVAFTAALTGNYTIRVAAFENDSGPYNVSAFANPMSFVTTDYNLLFFNKATGAFISALSATNAGTNQPVEFGALPFPNEATPLSLIQLVISRRSTPAPEAIRLRYVIFDSTAAALPSEYTSTQYPITYGHNCAADGHGVAAYSPFRPYIPEDFTSPGPNLNVFDLSGIRRAVPQLRRKPDLAAMDGANNTFFSTDTNRDTDTFPNFFGTSCAAPNAAACAALVLQKAGGPNTLSVPQMKSILQSTAFQHDLDPFFSRGIANTGSGKVTFQAQGDNSLSSVENTRGWSVSFVGSGAVATMSINVQNASPKSGNEVTGVTPGMVFDNRPFAAGTAGGFPFTLGITNGITPGDIGAAYSLPAPAPAPAGNSFFQLDLTFAAGTFTGGRSFSFAADRDEFRSAFMPPTGQTRDGGNPDLLADGVLIPQGTVALGSAVVTGTLVSGTPFTGQFRNLIGSGYTLLDGFGFINVEAAVNATPAP